MLRWCWVVVFNIDVCACLLVVLVVVQVVVLVLSGLFSVLLSLVV